MDPSTKNWVALIGMGVAAYLLFRRPPRGPGGLAQKCGCGSCGSAPFQATTYQYPEVYTRDAEDLAVSSRRLFAKYPEVRRF